MIIFIILSSADYFLVLIVESIKSQKIVKKLLIKIFQSQKLHFQIASFFQPSVQNQTIINDKEKRFVLEKWLNWLSELSDFRQNLPVSRAHWLAFTHRMHLALM